VLSYTRPYSREGMSLDTKGAGGTLGGGTCRHPTGCIRNSSSTRLRAYEVLAHAQLPSQRECIYSHPRSEGATLDQCTKSIFSMRRLPVLDTRRIDSAWQARGRPCPTTGDGFRRQHPFPRGSRSRVPDIANHRRVLMAWEPTGRSRCAARGVGSDESDLRSARGHRSLRSARTVARRFSGRPGAGYQ